MNITPKETAVELLDKHRTIIRKADLYGYLLSSDEIFLAKESALVTLKEIRGCIKWRHYPLDKQWSFWEEVKNEIEKL